MNHLASGNGAEQFVCEPFRMEQATGRHGESLAFKT